jgi:glutamine amidotransferase/cyclase
VRETPSEEVGAKGAVRNLGKPVALAQRYYEEGADEVVFLNITSFRQEVLEDAPMLQVLEQASENIFVPLTVGGGIRGYIDSTGREWTALEVASRWADSAATQLSLHFLRSFLNLSLLSRMVQVLPRRRRQDFARD